MAITHREMCRRRGFCLVEERHMLIEERWARKMRLYDDFRDVRHGWRDLRRAGRNFRRMLDVVFRAKAFWRFALRTKRRSLAD